MATILLVAAMIAGCRPDPAHHPVDTSVHTFYYGWYGSPETDGEPRHWSHDVLNVDVPQRFPGGEDIGADYFPQLGNYSSNEPAVLARHMEQCAAAGIGVVVASWWGEGSFEDRNLALLMDAAADHGLEVAIHLEPLPGRDARTSREALVYLLDRYGDHPALHRSAAHGQRPFVYIYDSYLSPAAEWRRLLHPEGDLTVRGTPYDVVAIGLWVGADEGGYFLEGGFDGIYTYFAADGFTYGSTVANWPPLASWAGEHGLTFVPCVGPGYIDTRIRPWNSATTRSREDGAYYDRMFAAALAVDPPAVGITSFNEWHEGTQIEPAAPKAIDGYTYEDYGEREPGWYLERTRYWVDRYRAGRSVTGK